MSVLFICTFIYLKQKYICISTNNITIFDYLQPNEPKAAQVKASHVLNQLKYGTNVNKEEKEEEEEEKEEQQQQKEHQHDVS